MVAPSEITPHLMTEAPIAPLAEIKMAKKINNSPFQVLHVSETEISLN
jgi:hypothetical protein